MAATQEQGSRDINLGGSLSCCAAASAASSMSSWRCSCRASASSDIAAPGAAAFCAPAQLPIEKEPKEPPPCHDAGSPPHCQPRICVIQEEHTTCKGLVLPVMYNSLFKCPRTRKTWYCTLLGFPFFQCHACFLLVISVAPAPAPAAAPPPASSPLILHSAGAYLHETGGFQAARMYKRHASLQGISPC